MAVIDDDRLVELQQAEALFKKLTANSSSKRLFEKAVKEINPDFVSEEDIARPFVEPIEQELKGLKEKIESRFKADDEARIDQQLAARFADLKKNNGLTEEGLESIKKIMVERKIPDVDAAVALFEKQTAPAPQPPSGLMPASWNFQADVEKSESDKMLWTNEDAWADREAAKVFNEETAKSRNGFGQP